LFRWLFGSNHTSSAIAGILPRLSESPAHTYTAKKRIYCCFAASRSHEMTNNRNVLYLIIGVLVVALSVVGYNLYQAKKEPDGLQINVGPNGLKIQNK
jgi:hypothetical protein